MCVTMRFSHVIVALICDCTRLHSSDKAFYGIMRHTVADEMSYTLCSASYSTPNWENPFFTHLSLCMGALSYCDREGPSLNCRHNVEKHILLAP